MKADKIILTDYYLTLIWFYVDINITVIVFIFICAFNESKSSEYAWFSKRNSLSLFSLNRKMKQMSKRERKKCIIARIVQIRTFEFLGTESNRIENSYLVVSPIILNKFTRILQIPTMIWQLEAYKMFGIKADREFVRRVS